MEDISKELLDDLKRIFGGTETTPKYETISPHTKEKVSFTPADLVIGGGKIKDSKGNKFKPKKRKGKSLSDMVMSPSFGKVKRK
ncbi:hypothetical protein CMI47_09000 [Candidatus Pacearchaeota archaeon]|jgi:hypothetical protein|nr:hypothetical protein [Candidatus Pacearchaeota archaeon]|tara:strand:- start:8892 stop:9143 length:252 start_codon:yes stop_codon:yes gene_type:complete